MNGTLDNLSRDSTERFNQSTRNSQRPFGLPHKHLLKIKKSP